METVTPDVSKQEEWFDSMVSTLRTHELQLETNTATDDQKSFYGLLMGGDADKIQHAASKYAKHHFVSKIIVKYLSLVNKLDVIKLAFAPSGSKVLVWAEINEDDENTERKIFMAGAKVNAEYHKLGYDIVATIVEDCDQLDIPNHYSIFKN